VALQPPANRRDDSHPSPGNTEAQPGQPRGDHFAGARFPVGFISTFLGDLRRVFARAALFASLARARPRDPTIRLSATRRLTLAHQHSGENHGPWPTAGIETSQSQRSRQAAWHIRSHGSAVHQGRRAIGVAHWPATTGFRPFLALVPGRAPGRLSPDASVVVCRSMSLMYREMGLLLMRNRSISSDVICPNEHY
jgi:hypothetical protein